MSDMLVKLYQLPEQDDIIKNLEAKKIIIRRALAPEKSLVIDWVLNNFNAHWASECDVCFSKQPISCYIAVQDKKILGFACYDAIAKDFFGPTGVGTEFRGNGVGKALLLKCLFAMKEEGYAYGIIGDAGPKDYYSKIVGASIIEDSTPGIYKGLL